MINPKRDPTRRCMPLAEWPENDRAAWAAALRRGDILDNDAGRAAHWRPATCTKVASSYGRFLTFLKLNGLFDRAAGPADRLNEGVLRSYITWLQDQVASVTLAQRVTELHEALRVMVPDGDFGDLRNAYQHLTAWAAPSRNKTGRLIHPRVLLGLALELMMEAEGFDADHMKRACRYRNGLIFGILVARAIRLSNLTSIRIGRHLIRGEPEYLLRFTGEETKNHAPLERWLPAVLTPHIEHYLTVHRPILLGDMTTDRLWISYTGRPLTDRSIYDAICEITKTAFGHPINPHLVRDCHATFIALDDPEHVRVIPLDLGNNDHATGERHYNQADTVSAARLYQKGIQALRRELVPPKRRTRRGRGRK